MDARQSDRRKGKDGNLARNGLQSAIPPLNCSSGKRGKRGAAVIVYHVQLLIISTSFSREWIISWVEGIVKNSTGFAPQNIQNEVRFCI